MSNPHEVSPPSVNAYRTLYASALAGEPGRQLNDQYRAKVTTDMTRRYKKLGEHDFIDNIFTIPDDFDLSLHPKPEIVDNPFSSLQDAGELTEGQISAAMTTAVNTNKLARGLKMALSENAPDSLVVDEAGQKVDCALFDTSLAPDDGRPHWGDQLIPIEFKRLSVRGDPFEDGKNDVEAAAVDRKKVRGQIISYAELVFSVQQRLHLIMIIFLGRKFRLLFWDRSGAVVSNAVDYYEDWELLCDIFWRLDLLARFYPEQLGIDPSATRIFPGDPDWETMDKAGAECPDDVDHTPRKPLKPDELIGSDHTFKYVRELFNASLVETWPRYRLEVPDGDGVRNFLVGRPYFRAKGLIGRGTRGYVALDTSTGCFTWLKDAWRVNYDGVGLEGDVLRELNEAGVPNVPTLVCHGDIRGQTTKTPEFWSLPSPPTPEQKLGNIPSAMSSARTLVNPPGSESLKRKRTTAATLPKPKGIPEESATDDDPCPLRLHNHYRVVVKQVGMPLTMFKNGKHLVWIILDCVYAHQGASGHNIIHRDVSGGNILLYPKVDTNRKGVRELRWAGMLTDWELSKRLDAPRKARQPERTGTWQYMSVAILRNPRRVVEIPDDLESFFHVLLYHAIRYLRSNLGDVEVADWIEDFFDCYTVTPDGSYNCGKKKLYVMTTSAELTSSEGTVSFDSPMDELLKLLLSSFKAFYAVKAYDEEQESLADAPSAENVAPEEPEDQEYDSDFEYDFDPIPGTTLKPCEPLAIRQPVKPVQTKYVPTAKDREIAANVSSHQALAILLHGFLRERWVKHDKIGDRVPVEWQPKKPVGPSIVSQTTAMKHKRRRTATASISGSLQSILEGNLLTPTKSSTASGSHMSRSKLKRQ